MDTPDTKKGTSGIVGKKKVDTKKVLLVVVAAGLLVASFVLGRLTVPSTGVQETEVQVEDTTEVEDIVPEGELEIYETAPEIIEEANPAVTE